MREKNINNNDLFMSLEREKKIVVPVVQRRDSLVVRVPVALCPCIKQIVNLYHRLELGEYVNKSYMLSIFGNEILEKFDNDSFLIQFESFKK
jgi:hypothetical protein